MFDDLKVKLVLKTSKIAEKQTFLWLKFHVKKFDKCCHNSKHDLNWCCYGFRLFFFWEFITIFVLAKAGYNVCFFFLNLKFKQLPKASRWLSREILFNVFSIMTAQNIRWGFDRCDGNKTRRWFSKKFSLKWLFFEVVTLTYRIVVIENSNKIAVLLTEGNWIFMKRCDPNIIPTSFWMTELQHENGCQVCGKNCSDFYWLVWLVNQSTTTLLNFIILHLNSEFPRALCLNDS